MNLVIGELGKCFNIKNDTQNSMGKNKTNITTNKSIDIKIQKQFG
jgi:hypothetical protein